MKDMLIIELKNIIKWFLIINLILFFEAIYFVICLLDYEMASLNDLSFYTFSFFCNVFLEDL